MRECTDQKNSEYGRFLRSGGSSLNLEITEDWFQAYSEKTFSGRIMAAKKIPPNAVYQGNCKTENFTRRTQQLHVKALVKRSRGDVVRTSVVLFKTSIPDQVLCGMLT